MTDLTRIRISTTLKTAELELPSAFAEATAATEARLLAIPSERRTAEQRRSLRRAASKARRVG